MPPMKRLFALVVMLIVLSAATCADDGDAESDGANSSAPVGEPDRSSEAGESSDDPAREIGAAGLVRLQDFPAGWREDEANEDALEYHEVDECRGLAEQLEQSLVRVESPAFTRAEDEAQVGNWVRVFSDETTATQAHQGFTSADAQRCFATFVDRALQRNLSQGDPLAPQASEIEVVETRVGRLSIDPVGDAAGAWQAQITLSSPGFEGDVFVDAVAVRVGRAMTVINFASFFSPFFDDDRDPILDAVIARLESVQRTSR